MKLITKTEIKVIDIEYLENPIINEDNWLYSKPELFEPIYGVKFNIEASSKSERNKSDMIKVNANRRIIIFSFDDGSQVWENMKVHKLRKKFIKKWKNGNIQYKCGYIQGLHSPIVGASKGMTSSSSFNGYQFWQKVII